MSNSNNNPGPFPDNPSPPKPLNSEDVAKILEISFPVGAIAIIVSCAVWCDKISLPTAVEPILPEAPALPTAPALPANIVSDGYIYDDVLALRQDIMNEFIKEEIQTVIKEENLVNECFTILTDDTI